MTSDGFPEPVGHLDGSPIWRWSDVRAWAEGAAGSPAGPSEEGLRLAGIRDRFRAAGFRLKIAPDRGRRRMVGGPRRRRAAARRSATPSTGAPPWRPPSGPSNGLRRTTRRATSPSSRA